MKAKPTPSSPTETSTQNAGQVSASVATASTSATTDVSSTFAPNTNDRVPTGRTTAASSASTSLPGASGSDGEDGSVGRSACMPHAYPTRHGGATRRQGRDEGPWTAATMVTYSNKRLYHVSPSP